MLNVYDELGIDPSEPTASIRERLSRIKANDATRASRSDAAGEAARLRISQIEEVEPSFVDDTSRDAYDSALHTQATTATPTGPNWLQLAWSYYAQEDFGPAEVAARKARETDKDNPDVWVVSAWIALAPVTRHPLASDESWDDVLKRFQRENRTAAHDPESALAALVESAKKYADEAYTPFGSAAAGDVAHVRGVCFYFQRDYPRAIQSYTNALETTEDPAAQGELYLRLTLAYETIGDVDQTLYASENLMRVTQDLSDPTMLNYGLRLWAKTVVGRPFLPEDELIQIYKASTDRAMTIGLRENVTDLLVGFCQQNLRQVEEHRQEREEYQQALTRYKEKEDDFIRVSKQHNDDLNKQAALWSAFYRGWSDLQTKLSFQYTGSVENYDSMQIQPVPRLMNCPPTPEDLGDWTPIQTLKDFAAQLEEISPNYYRRPMGILDPNKRIIWDMQQWNYEVAQKVLAKISSSSQPALHAFRKLTDWLQSTGIESTAHFNAASAARTQQPVMPSPVNPIIPVEFAGAVVLPDEWQDSRSRSTPLTNEQKTQMIMKLRAETGISLGEAKDIVDQGIVGN